MTLSDLDAQAAEIVRRYEYPKAAMLPLLWLVQQNMGYISTDAEAWVGRMLGVAVSHVREVVSFYNMFRTLPVGRRELRVCTGLPCVLRGAKGVLEQIEEELQIKSGETTPGQEVTLTEVECLCACEMAPMAQLDERFVGPLEGETIGALIRDAFRESEKPESTPEPEPYICSNGPVLSTRFQDPAGTWFDTYRNDGGYRAASKVLTSMTPEQVIDEVSKARLRGLGGAGFPTGKKWTFIPKQSTKPRYLVVNADEGEPGTFKDRYILERDPHALLEGILIAAYAIGSRKAYVYIRGEYFRPARRLQHALDEAYRHGWLGKNIQGTGFDLDVVIHRGAGAYICGEETALLTSLEGGKGFPRIKPPFPAISGLFACPTIVNNVETLACVPFILREGAGRFAALGPEAQGGTRLFCVSGHVVRPGVYEESVGITLRDLIERAGGVRNGNRLKRSFRHLGEDFARRRDRCCRGFNSLMAAEAWPVRRCDRRGRDHMYGRATPRSVLRRRVRRTVAAPGNGWVHHVIAASEGRGRLRARHFCSDRRRMEGEPSPSSPMPAYLLVLHPSDDEKRTSAPAQRRESAAVACPS